MSGIELGGCLPTQIQVNEKFLHFKFTTY